MQYQSLIDSPDAGQGATCSYRRGEVRARSRSCPLGTSPCVVLQHQSGRYPEYQITDSLPRGRPLGGGRRDLQSNFHTSRYTTVWKGNIVTLQQQIAEKFLTKLAASKDVDIEKIEQLRRLLADTKKPKPEEFVRIFSLTAGDDLK